MDGVIGGIIVALVTGGLGYLGIRYKAKKDSEVKPEDPVQTLLKRYDIDRENDRKDMITMRQRITDAEAKAEEAEAKAQAAEDKYEEVLTELRSKDQQIEALKKRVSNQQTQYGKLLKRFNALKLKYEKKDKVAEGV